MILLPNLNLELPTVETTTGPLWATQINAILTAFDASVGTFAQLTFDVTSPVSGNLLVYDGTNWANVALSGDVTITSAGVATVDTSGIDHDALLNFVANEHIDHTSVSINTATGLTGGGDISGTRTLDFDIGSLTALGSAAAADVFLVYDDDAGTHKKITAANLPGGTVSGLTDTVVAGEAGGDLLIYDGVDSWDNQAVTGDVTISSAGVTAIASDVIVNADVKTNAAIAHSKMAALTASRAMVTDGSGFASASSVTATELGYVSGVTSAIQTQMDTKLANVVEDTTPQLGGNLDVNGNSIVSVAAGNISITPDTTGSVILDGTKWPQTSGTNTYVLTTDGVDQASWTDPSTIGFTDPMTTRGDVIIRNASNVTARLPIGANNTFLGSDGTDITWTAETSIDHDTLTNFVANEHIDHTSVTLTAGTALSGGGDISANRTFNVSISGETDLATPAVGDELLISDIDDSNNVKKADVASIVNLADHDALTNFVANEHIDHTSVTLTAGIGLTGGGDISANRTFDLDITGLTAKTTVPDAYEFAMYDTGTSTHKKVTWANMQSDISITESQISDLGTYLSNVVEDTTPQLGGNLDSNNFHIELKNSGTATELRLYEPSGGGSSYTGFKAQAMATNPIYTLPAASGSAGQVLTWNASDILTWSNAGSGDIVDGGNTNGANVVIGTNDAFDLELERNNATKVTIGATTIIVDDAHVELKNTGTAQELRFYEPSGGGTSYAGFKSPALAGNTIYTLPTAFPSATTDFLTSTTGGVLAWKTEASIDHDALTNFVANEHINHTSVNIDSGDGLSGGGDISSTRTLALDFNGMANTSTTLGASDLFAFYDATTDTRMEKITFANLEGALNHDSLTGFVANEHIDWTAAGSNLSTSGTIASTNTTDATSATTGAVKVTGGLSAQKNIVSGGAVWSVHNDKGNSGTTLTITWTDANLQTVTLNNNCTFTFAGAYAGMSVALILKQDAIGSRTVTWPTISWVGGSEPTLSTAANSVDIIGFIYDGTTWYGGV